MNIKMENISPLNTLRLKYMYFNPTKESRQSEFYRAMFITWPEKTVFHVTPKTRKVRDGTYLIYCGNIRVIV